ncbi:MAG TPA: hypothetical protein VF820_05555 [Patescibacteria group bacterium]
MKRNIFIFLIIFISLSVFDRNFWNTFFQQDEWNGFGTVIALSHGSSIGWFGVLGSYHFVPFSQLLYFGLYKLFEYQAQYFAITSLILHAFATLLVYTLYVKLTKKKFLSVILSLFFAFNVNTSQAYLHLAIFPATVTCFIATMIFFVYLEKISSSPRFTIKNVFILLALFFLSVGLREDGLLIILLFPLWSVLFAKKFLKKENRLSLGLFGGIIAAFFLFRFALQIFTPHVISLTKDSYWVTFLINLVWFAPKIFAQTFIDGNSLLMFVWNFAQKFVGFQIDLNTALKILLPSAFIVIDVLLAGILIAGYRLSKKTERKLIIFGVGWAVAYSILLSAIGRQMDILESRYLYFPSFGVLLAVVTASSVLIQKLLQKQKKFKQYIVAGCVLLIIFFLFFSYKGIRSTIDTGVIQGNARKSILSSLQKLYPTIPKKAVIYVRCKTVCYRNAQFGIPNTVVLPFSSGPGYIFLLQYARRNETAYARFFRKQKNGIEFLWDYGAEGYKEMNGYGFGYFIHEDLLRSNVVKYHIPLSDVIGLEYNENTFTFTDISSQVRKEISQTN